MAGLVTKQVKKGSSAVRHLHLLCPVGYLVCKVPNFLSCCYMLCVAVFQMSLHFSLYPKFTDLIPLLRSDLAALYCLL